MIYLASPYHHPDPLIRDKRLQQAENAMHQLFSFNVFSPIAHNGPSSERLGPHTSADYLLFDFEILSKCTVLCILDIPGWQTSRGVLLEIGFAIANDLELRIVYQVGSAWCWKKITKRDLLDLLYKD